MQNFDSPYTTSVCNYFDESPNNIKFNYQISKINQINLNNYFNENDSLVKEESQNLKLNPNQIKNTKSQLNLNTNSQSHSIKNYNTSSMSFQYSDSEKKSDYSKSIIKISKEEKNEKKNNFVIEKNENLEIITSNHDYQVSQCISNNKIFSAFSIEINPKKTKEKTITKTNNLKFENIQKDNSILKKLNDINYLNKDSDIKYNNGFRLVPLSIIEEKFSTPSNSKKNKNKDSSPKNCFLKNYGKTVEREDKIFNFMKNNFNKNNNNENNIQIKKIIEKDNNNNQNNSKGKKKYIVKSKNNSKQKDEIKIKPNSNNDINDIIQRHFQQKNITKFISKSKKENNSIDDKKNNRKVISYTFFQNNYPKKNISPQISNNLLEKKNNKTHNYSSSGKNYINKNLNPDDSKLKTKQEINIIHQNKRQKIKTYINLSSILNKFYSKSVKKTNNKSLGVFTEILSNNNFLNDTKNNMDDNIKKNLFNVTFDKNDNKINKNNSIKIPEKKNNIKEISNSNNNSYLSRIIHTQDTVNSSKENNNYINTTTNLSPNRKSPQVINDFSFYKRKMNYKGHFISLVSPKESNKTYGNTYINTNNTNNTNDINFLENNICNSEYKIHPNRKPIASIKLMKLEGDIDSNISRDSDL